MPDFSKNIFANFMPPNPLPREFYDRDAREVAPEMLGKLVIRRTRTGLVSGVIVEVEAYLGKRDPASHSYRGKTKRNATMFGPPGHLYVYTIHARFCMNVVTEPIDVASAILIRAVEPLDGIPLMQRRRQRDRHDELTRGPARLCEAADVDCELDGWDLTKGQKIWIAEDSRIDGREFRITTSPRIGISSNQDAKLRFFVDGNRFVSGPRKFHSQKVSDQLSTNVFTH